MFKEAYILIAKMGPGMFSTERGVGFLDHSGRMIEGFFDESNLIGEDWLQVSAGVCEGPLIQCILPQQPLNAGAIVFMRKQDVCYEV